MAKEISIIIGGRIQELLDIPEPENVEVYEQIKIGDAITLAMQCEKNGVQAIISTGGTASSIENHVGLPVIRANPTYFDLLETFKHLETEEFIVGEHIAVLLHRSRNILIDRLHQFLNNTFTLFHYQDEDDLQNVIHLIATKNFRIVVGGPSTMFFAKQQGLCAYPLYLGRETILTAYEKAKSIIGSIKKERAENQRLYTIMDLFNDGILAVDDKGSVTICNPRGLEILGLQKDEVIGKKIYQVMCDPNWTNIYEKGLNQVDEIIEFKDRKLFTTRRPIIMNNKIIGAVGTFQEVSKIEKLEHAYRKLQTLGLTAKYNFKDIVGCSEIINKTIDSAKAYSKVNSTILITGETGTGKEIFAQSIHNLSHCRYGPFVAINCAALPENLLESELMGYEEGAFTGAKRGGKAGLFELAHKGTIFLDEVNQIPVTLQARILRILQERQVLRLGGAKVIPVDVRIIAATNEDLERKITAGTFREDLYYRLNVLSLPLPALRSRLEDIPLLTRHFLNVFVKTYGPVKPFSEKCLQLMAEYDWPGNVRELINFIERYIVLNKQQAVADIGFASQYITDRRFKLDGKNLAPADNTMLVTIDTLNKMENQIIQQMLKLVSGNKVKASLMLGISRTTLWKKQCQSKE